MVQVDPPVAPATGAFFANPKSRIFRTAALRDEDVCGFDVAMDDSRGTGRIQSVGEFDAQRKKCLDLQGASGDTMLQCRSIQEFHDDEWHVVATVAPLALPNSLITLYFLLFRAVCALGFRVARFPDLAGFVATSGACAPDVWLCAAFQIRPTAVLRLWNFRTGFTPGIRFHISTRRAAGRLAVSSSSSLSVVNRSMTPAGTVSQVPDAVMLLSPLIVKAVIDSSPCRRCGR
jgi:hypothetical protein